MPMPTFRVYYTNGNQELYLAENEKAVWNHLLHRLIENPDMPDVIKIEVAKEYGYR